MPALQRECFHTGNAVSVAKDPSGSSNSMLAMALFKDQIVTLEMPGAFRSLRLRKKKNSGSKTPAVLKRQMLLSRTHRQE
jgi:hypothetical protein